MIVCLCVNPVIDWCPAQSVPHLFPEGTWNWLSIHSVYPFINLSILLSTSPSVHLFPYLSIHLLIYLCNHAFDHQFIHQSFHFLSIHPTIHSVHSSIFSYFIHYPSIHPSFHLFIFFSHSSICASI